MSLIYKFTFTNFRRIFLFAIFFGWFYFEQREVRKLLPRIANINIISATKVLMGRAFQAIFLKSKRCRR